MEAINRYGVIFSEGEEVKMVDSPVWYPSMIGQVLVIEEIKDFDACESGKMILVSHKESGNRFKNFLDTNWFSKLDNK